MRKSRGYLIPGRQALDPRTQSWGNSRKWPFGISGWFGTWNAIKSQRLPFRILGKSWMWNAAENPKSDVWIPGQFRTWTAADLPQKKLSGFRGISKRGTRPRNPKGFFLDSGGTLNVERGSKFPRSYVFHFWSNLNVERDQKIRRVTFQGFWGTQVLGLRRKPEGPKIKGRQALQ